MKYVHRGGLFNHVHSILFCNSITIHIPIEVIIVVLVKALTLEGCFLHVDHILPNKKYRYASPYLVDKICDDGWVGGDTSSYLFTKINPLLTHPSHGNLP